MISVLIVDDEHWNREIIWTLGDWGKLGMEVAGEAEDGESALRLIEELSPQIVVTDMRMPGKDGVGLMENLTEHYPEIRVIVVSGYDDFAYTKHAIRHKAVDYLLKPVDPMELNEALAKCKAALEEAADEDERRRIALMDKETVRAFSAFKQRIRHAFNDLNREGLQSAFGGMADELDSAGSGKPGVLERIRQEMLHLLSELLAYNGLDAGDQFCVESTMNGVSVGALARVLSALYLQAMERVAEQRKFKNRLNLNDVREYIALHMAEPLSLEGIARVFFVSKEYLSKVFKQEFGVTVMDYVVQLRMERAREGLRDERIPIKTIAEMAGYEDMSYFYRVFKKHFGMAPGEMRKLGQV